MLNKRVVYEIPGMEGNCSRHDSVYKAVDGVELKMAVYTPNRLAAGEKTPGILFIHGGPFPSDISLLPTEWGQYISLGQLAAASGLIGATFHHRYHGLERLNESASDVGDAIKYLRENADSFGLDPDRLCLWAVSGGGPLLAAPMRRRPDYLKCIVAYYARLDMRGSKAAEEVLGREALVALSPVAALEEVDSLAIPIFVARAGRDDPGLNQSIDDFIATALSREVPLELHNHPQGPHAFDLLDDSPRSKEIIERTMAFARLHLQAEV